MALGTRLLDSAGTQLARITQKFGLAGSVDGSLHVAQYPIALTTSEGAYRAGAISGTMAAGLAANSQIFQLRWTSATLNCLLRSVKLSASVAGTAFAAGAPTFEMRLGRSYTVSGSGGNAVTLTGNNCKNRTDFPTSAVGDMRCASTGTLTSGTVTLDTICSAITGSTGTATTGVIVPADTSLYGRITPDEYPVMFEQNEGFVIRCTVPATGTWVFAVNVEWSEVLVTTF